MLILSTTDIANRALYTIGAGAINNIEDTTKPARLCHAHLGQAVEDILTDHIFPRTITQQSLTTIESDFPEWSYLATLPGDYIRGVRITDDYDTEASYEIIGPYLYTNVATPNLYYVSNEVDWSLVGSRLVDAVAMRLAVLICSELTPDPNTKMRVLQEAERAKTKAVEQAAKERFPVKRTPIMWGADLI